MWIISNLPHLNYEIGIKAPQSGVNLYLKWLLYWSCCSIFLSVFFPVLFVQHILSKIYTVLYSQNKHSINQIYIIIWTTWEQKKNLQKFRLDKFKLSLILRSLQVHLNSNQSFACVCVRSQFSRYKWLMNQWLIYLFHFLLLSLSLTEV